MSSGPDSWRPSRDWVRGERRFQDDQARRACRLMSGVWLRDWETPCVVRRRGIGNGSCCRGRIVMRSYADVGAGRERRRWAAVVRDARGW